MSTDTKFDWSTVPDWVTFRAQDEDGSWFGYRFIPRTSLHNWKSAGGDVIRISESEGRNPNWFMSLEMRHSCKQSTDCEKSDGYRSLSPLEIQISGNHYKKMGAYQPWEVLPNWLTPDELRGFAKGTVIAYLARERDKGGLDDIRKARHTLQLYEAVLAKQHEEPDLGTAVQALAEELNRKCRCEPKDPACKQWYDSLPKEEQDDGK